MAKIKSPWTSYYAYVQQCTMYKILTSALKKSRPRYISAQIISTLFDALDEREIAR
jgi:hypothetical protein